MTSVAWQIRAAPSAGRRVAGLTSQNRMVPQLQRARTMSNAYSKWVLLSMLAVICAGASRSVDAAVVSREPYLQLATAHSITIVWRTMGKIAPRVSYWRKNEQPRIVPSSAIQVRVAPDVVNEPQGPKLHSSPDGVYQYEATIFHLSPSTTYYYAISDGQERLFGNDESHQFTTYPERGVAAPVRIWAVGDSGTGEEPQAQVHRGMLKLTSEQRRPIDMFLHVGDMAYSDGTDEEFSKKFFAVYAPTLSHVVCWPTQGNHEGHTSKGIDGVGPYYDAYVVPTRAEAGGVASGHEAYYSFDYGAMHAICLDSHDLDRRQTGAMARWLKADLEKTKADWLIAFWHHPPYSKGSHDSDTEVELIEMREQIMPILEDHGVDLVLTGHSHIYERSMLIDGAYATPTVADNVILDDGDGDPNGDGPYRKSPGLTPHAGAVQVVTGHGGADLGRKGTSPVMKRVFLEHGSCLVDIDGQKLTGTMLSVAGEIRDSFEISKRDHVTPQRVAHPRLLLASVAADPPAATVQKTEPTSAATGAKQPKKKIPFATKPPEGVENLTPEHGEFKYLAGGEHPANDDWTKATFDASAWKTGNAGFGYADDDDVTELPDMQNKYTVIYVRAEFSLPCPADEIEELGLVINYDDGFVAYVNGTEVKRVGVGAGKGKDAKNVVDHEAMGYEYFPLPEGLKALQKEKNVLALEGHNRSLESTDLSLDPYLVIKKKKK